MVEPDLDAEQMEVIGNVDEIRQRFRGRELGWNRLRGDATARVLEHFIQRHLPKRYKLARCAWVEGCEDEFDLLFIEENATPLPFTNMYHEDDVHLIVEVKSSGLFYKKSEIDARLREWKKKVQEETGKTILYLSFWERPGHYCKVLEAIGESDAFILKVKDKVKHDEWGRFIGRVRTLLPQTAAEFMESSKAKPNTARIAYPIQTGTGTAIFSR